jgi:hypothetical protein
MNVTTAPFTPYVPATTIPFACTFTLVLFTVAGFTPSLNVTVIAVFTATPVAPLTGVNPVTCKGPASSTGDVLVVNPLVNACTAFPARSVNPPTVTVYAVFTASALAGVNVTTVPLALTALTVPDTATPLPVSVIPFVPTLTTLTVALTATCTTAFTGTPTAPFGGLTVTTTGAAVCVPAPV